MPLEQYSCLFLAFAKETCIGAALRNSSFGEAGIGKRDVADEGLRCEHRIRMGIPEYRSRAAFVQGGVVFRSVYRTSTSQLAPRCCAQSPAPPSGLPEAIRIAGTAFRNAKLPQRAQVHFLIPGLNTNLEDTYPYSDSLLSDTALLLGEAVAEAYVESAEEPPDITLLFKSAGTAAAAQAYYSKAGSSPELLSSGRVKITSFALRDAPRKGTSLVPENSVAVLVNPATARGDKVVDDVLAVVDNEAARTFVLLNPDFSADVSALGIGKRGKRDEFLKSFAPVFYLRTLAYIKRPTLVAKEKGALLRAFPSLYTVWKLQSTGEYEAMQTFAHLPSRNEVTDALEAAPKLRARPAGSSKVSEEDVVLLRTLVFLAVAASGTFYALRRMAPFLDLPG